jgi:hypothetical protein
VEFTQFANCHASVTGRETFASASLRIGNPLSAVAESNRRAAAGSGPDNTDQLEMGSIRWSDTQGTAVGQRFDSHLQVIPPKREPVAALAWG